MRKRSLLGIGALLGAVVVLGPGRAYADPGGSITGVVTDEAGAPLAGICVEAYPFVMFSWSMPANGVSSGPTDSSGSYSIPGLAAGDYKVRFADCSGNQHFPLWYQQHPDFQSAQMVQVQAGATLSGIDAQLGPGGLLTGAITDQSGNPEPGICVSGQWQPASTGPETTDTVLSGSSGGYALPVRADDPYQVRFSVCPYGSNTGNFLTQYYDGQSDPTQANLVTAGQGQTVPGIDAVLQPGGEITGQLTDSAGNAVAGVCAQVITGPGQVQSSPPSDATGTYILQRLATGSYDVSFYECDNGTSNWATQSYPTPVSVTAGEVTSGIDTTMVKAGSISGTVTDTGGNPVPGVCVEASGSSAMIMTDSNGHYFVPELKGGTYTVFFSTGCAGAHYYLAQYYDGASDAQDATPVTVTMGQDTSGIDAHLVLGGRITGTITEPAGGPSETICVEATDGAGHQYQQPAWGGGNYLLGPVVPGSYTVSFTDCGDQPTYRTQWYHGQAAAAAADPVTVVGGQDTTGIDAAMGGALVPYVAGISPTEGGSGGGTSVTISGAGFTGAGTIRFGAQPATNFQVVSDSQVTAIAPPGAVGTVDVTVTGPGGTSAPGPADRYTYKTQPTVSSVTPGSGTAGMVVRVAGTHLSHAGIYFGTAPGTVVEVLSDTDVLVRVPSGTGTVDVTAVLAGISSAPNPADRFTYLL
ncbi:MAG TPA: carboxypeptidase-like regulatory domain-containing protein [Acidimicrobiales bacterium]|nr:carboxypeptidase-like regulatory domain-containing protein [Acidimicrobiales bacterium]